MRVNSLELCWFIDGDVSVDSHTDNYVHRASHEGVDHWDLHVGLVHLQDYYYTILTSLFLVCSI